MTAVVIVRFAEEEEEGEGTGIRQGACVVGEAFPAQHLPVSHATVFAERRAAPQKTGAGQHACVAESSQFLR